MLLRDTRQAVQRLREGGLPEEQANAIVDLFVNADEEIATQQGLNDLGVKIDEVEQRLNTQIEDLDIKIDDVEQRLNAKIDDVEKRLNTQIEDLDTKIDEVEQRLNTQIGESEQRLGQQMEVQEERLTRKIQKTETRLLRWGVGSFAALAALLTLFEFVL